MLWIINLLLGILNIVVYLNSGNSFNLAVGIFCTVVAAWSYSEERDGYR